MPNNHSSADVWALHACAACVYMFMCGAMCRPGSEVEVVVARFLTAPPSGQCEEVFQTWALHGANCSRVWPHRWVQLEGRRVRIGECTCNVAQRGEPAASCCLLLYMGSQVQASKTSKVLQTVAVRLHMA